MKTKKLIGPFVELLRRLLNWIAPVGYQNESGFHLGPEPKVN